MMKFAALALALLLAVGSQAAVLQADAPSDFEHHFTLFKMGINGLKKSLSPLDGTEYSYVKDWIQQMLEHFDAMVTEKKTDIISFIETIKESYSESFDFDYERIRNELTPLFAQLRIREHIQQYIEMLGPIMTDIMTEYQAATHAIVPKIEPKVEQLRAVFRVNAMDTKEKLIPILAVLQRELTTLHGKVKEVVDGYVQEYREHVSGVVQRFQSLTPDQLAARREEANRVVQEIIEKFTQLQEIALREGN